MDRWEVVYYKNGAHRVKKVFIVAVCHFMLLRGGIIFYTPFSSILWSVAKKPEIQCVAKKKKEDK